MSLVKREAKEGRLTRVMIDLHSELEELCSNAQEKMAQNRSDFKKQLEYTIGILKDEIDHAGLMHFKEVEEVDKEKSSEIDQLQIMLNEMIREFENPSREMKKAKSLFTYFGA